MGDNVSYGEPGEYSYRVPPPNPEVIGVIGNAIVGALNSMFPEYESGQPKTESDSNLVDKLT